MPLIYSTQVSSLVVYKVDEKLYSYWIVSIIQTNPELGKLHNDKDKDDLSS